VSAGPSPMEALQTATLRAAEFLGVQREFGSVEPGKTANLVLLDANPVEDIRGLRRVRSVIVPGHVLDRAKLDDLLAHTQCSRATRTMIYSPISR
jgi:imidazolonepropionase-like amidohydrolase